MSFSTRSLCDNIKIKNVMMNFTESSSLQKRIDQMFMYIAIFIICACLEASLKG